jgi:hypothetical protein
MQTYLKLDWHGISSCGEGHYVVDKVFEAEQSVLVDIRVYIGADLNRFRNGE